MVFDIEYRKEKDYLYMKYKGDDTDSVLASLDEVFLNCKRWDYSKLIIDLRDFDISVISDINRYFFGLKLAELNKEVYRVKVGVILNKKDYGGIGELAAINRGLGSKSFFNENDTLKWLLE